MKFCAVTPQLFCMTCSRHGHAYWCTISAEKKLLKSSHGVLLICVAKDVKCLAFPIALISPTRSQSQSAIATDLPWFAFLPNQSAITKPGSSSPKKRPIEMSLSTNDIPPRRRPDDSHDLPEQKPLICPRPLASSPDGSEGLK